MEVTDTRTASVRIPVVVQLEGIDFFKVTNMTIPGTSGQMSNEDIESLILSFGAGRGRGCVWRGAVRLLVNLAGYANIPLPSLSHTGAWPKQQPL